MKKYIYPNIDMKTFSKLPLVALAALTFSCEQPDELAEKKAELATAKTEYHDLRVKIEALEKEISAMDTTFAKQNRKSVLITTVKSQKQPFEHYVEVTGSVLSKKNVNISAEVSGRVEEIKAMEGMHVSKGAVLARIDAESVDNSIDELEKQLELANILYEKQKRLWDKQIGTEVQYLESKNRKETLEKNLASLKTQKGKATITAPFDGTVEEVTVRLGELVQPGMPIINFVGESDLYIEGDISESYVGVLERGDSVQVEFPSLNREIDTKVTAVGAIINPDNRTFKVEVFLPKLKHVKPNMVSVLRIKDYQNQDAVTVPTNLIQRDNKGEYVYVVDNNTAKKQYVSKGETYEHVSEIKEGLKGGEAIIEKGFREVADGSKVQIVEN
ncbi:efflux RND transporter periplasmic adaptor subunit [Echinicola arenosa]|nr:efflux RND transporter periplasmic adaptor subunit [Echinicola arenosa]